MIYWYLILIELKYAVLINIGKGTTILILRRDNKIYINHKRLANLSCKLRFIKCMKHLSK